MAQGKNGIACLYVDSQNVTPINQVGGTVTYKQSLINALTLTGVGSSFVEGAGQVDSFSTYTGGEKDFIRIVVKKQWYMGFANAAEASNLYQTSLAGSLQHSDTVWQTILGAMGGTHASVYTGYFGPERYYAGPMDGEKNWEWAHFQFRWMGIPEEIVSPSSVFARRERILIHPDLAPWNAAPNIVNGIVDTVYTRQRWIDQIRALFLGGQIYFDNNAPKREFSGNNKSRFYDGVFSYKKPVQLSGPDSNPLIAAQPNSQVAEVQPIYNFHVPPYENAISNEDVLEAWLPNLQAFLSEKWSENLDSDHSIFDKLIKLGGLLQEMFTDILNSQGQKIGEKDLGHYYDRWATMWDAVGTHGIAASPELLRKFAELAVRYFHIVFPAEALEELVGFNEYVSQFPMAVNLGFSTDGPTKLAKILKETRASGLLLAEIIKDNRPLNSAGDLDIPNLGAPVLTQAAAEFETSSGMPLITNFENSDYIHRKEFTEDSTTQIGLLVSAEEIKGNNKIRRLDMTQWWREYMPLEIPAGGLGGPTYHAVPDPLSDAADEIMTEISTFLGTRSEEAMATYQDPGASVLLSMILALFGAGMEQIIRAKARTYKQILDGELAYSETLCYRVQKMRKGEDSQNRIVQNFYFSKNDELSFIDFIDTQVKYNTEYTYTIFAYQAVFGTEYEYVNLQIQGEPIANPNFGAGHTVGLAGEVADIVGPDAGIPGSMQIPGAPGLPEPGPGQEHRPKDGPAPSWILPGGVRPDPLGASIDVITIPKVMLVEVPYTEFRKVRVHDYPPLPPEIKIYPYYAVNNKIQIHLSPGHGEGKLTPVLIEENDIYCFGNALQQQRYENKELNKKLKKLEQGMVGAPAGTSAEDWLGKPVLSYIKLKFRTDDLLAGYDVYRVSKRPTSYKDFAGNRLSRVSCDVDPDSPGFEQYLLFDDTVRPNTKYYYTFRSIDIHGNISNPTSVFEVEMVDDAGTVWQRIDVIEFEEEKPSQPTRAMKRFMRIKPTSIQSILNMSPGAIASLINAPSTAGQSGPILQLPVGASLGKASRSVWGKQFKVRLVSRDTGKKIDINFNCSYKFEANDLLNNVNKISQNLTATGVKKSTLYNSQTVATALNSACSPFLFQAAATYLETLDPAMLTSFATVGQTAPATVPGTTAVTTDPGTGGSGGGSNY